MFALARYINPGSGPGAETIGTSNSSQGQLGLNNAYASIANLVSIAAGATPAAPVTHAGSGTAAGVTVTATSESAKIITIANILGACINTPAANSNRCADLFASATPPTTADVTSLSGGTFATATDTIQAAYYLAVNPANNGAFTSCQNGATTTRSCLFNSIPPVPAFAGGLGSQPTDWTIGVTYSATGTCTNGNALIAGPNKVSIDGNGNIWFINNAATSNGVTIAGGSSMVQLSPVGTPLTCVGSQSAGRGLTIDTAGNVWGAFNGSPLSTAIQEVPNGGSSSISWRALAAPLGLAADYAGNVNYSSALNGGSFYQFDSPGSNTTPFASTRIATGFNGTADTPMGYLITDGVGRLYGVSSSIPNLLVAAYSSSGYLRGTIALPKNAFGVAVDTNGALHTGTDCCAGSSGSKLIRFSPAAGTGSNGVSSSSTYVAGVNGSRATAVDGAGNIWYGYELPAYPAAGATPALYAVGEAHSTGDGTTATFTSLSPTGTASSCTASSCYTNGGFGKADFTIVPDLAIDPSGNVWVLNGGTDNTTVPSNGTTLTEIVGAAVPTSTPLSLALYNGTVGSKP